MSARERVTELELRVERLEEELARQEIVELYYCIGKECLREHGIRVATWRGYGPCSAYIVCDECHDDRLTEEERKHMVEVRGVDRVRHLGLNRLHLGREAQP